VRLLQLRGGDAQLRTQPLFHALRAGRGRCALGVRAAGQAGQTGEGERQDERWGLEMGSGHGDVLRSAH
jgi:hypothetical protein